MDSELEARLRVLLDKQEIHEVIMRYCRGIDRADRALEAAEPPEDWSGSVDVESTEDTAAGSDLSGDESGGLRASALDGIDLFE